MLMYNSVNVQLYTFKSVIRGQGVGMCYYCNVLRRKV